MAFDGALAVLLAAKYCRTFPLFQWREEALPAIGQRRDKFSFRVDLANLLQDRCGEMLMTLFPASLSFVDFQKDRDALYQLKALLVTLKHPYILPVVEIYYSKEKRALLVVQPFERNGSLLDRIHSRANPTKPYEEKYQRDRAAPLPIEEVAKFGRQVLEALKALRSKGVVCDHLSAGNIVLDEQENARIAEIYTPLLAIDRNRHSRELTVPLEAKVDVDILLFGHVLYEMATGKTLTTPAPDDAALEQMQPEIADVLDWIFYPTTRKDETAVDARDDLDADSQVDDDTESVTTTTSTSSKSGVAFRTDIDELLGFPLFVHADVAPIDTLFSAFRLDSGMKSTVRRSMRVNASRNHAYVVQYKDAMAMVRAKQRAERRVYDEKEKNEKRAQHQLLVSRGVATTSTSESTAVPSRRKSYRAHSFKAPLQRQASSSPSTTSA